MMTQITLFILVTSQEEISNSRKFDFCMNILNMPLKISVLSSLTVTLIARIFDFLMYRLNMALKIFLYCSLMIALIARIFDFLMYRLNMRSQV